MPGKPRNQNPAARHGSHYAAKANQRPAANCIENIVKGPADEIFHPGKTG